MNIHLMGKKIGMTQLFDEKGRVIPVTVLKVGPCIVVDKKTEEKDGYSAIVLGFEDTRESKLRESEIGLFKKMNITPKKFLRESRVSKDELEKFNIGQEINVSLFKKGESVDVTGKTKGRGFTGVIKRHGMAGAKASHGTHEHFRHVGSIGASAFPSRVFKGKKMPGRYGAERVTIQNLLIADIKPEKNIILVKGAVPGPNKGYIAVTHAVKNTVSG